MSAEASAHNLTGVWNGLYTYPDGRSVAFVATLIESGGALSGTTHEPGVGAGVPSGTLYATLAGSRADNAVSFCKTYDGDLPQFRAVEYAGTLNGEATEIEGRWIIPSVWSGKFLMIRPDPDAARAERKIAQRA
jgi:hypothetical protein